MKDQRRHIPVEIEFRIKGSVYPAVANGWISEEHKYLFCFVDDSGYAYLNPVPLDYLDFIQDSGEFETEMTFDEALQTLVESHKAKISIEQDPEVQEALERAKANFVDWKKKNILRIIKMYVASFFWKHFGWKNGKDGRD